MREEGLVFPSAEAVARFSRAGTSSKSSEFSNSLESPLIAFWSESVRSAKKSSAVRGFLVGCRPEEPAVAATRDLLHADSSQTSESRFLVKSCLGNDVIKALTDVF